MFYNKEQTSKALHETLCYCFRNKKYFLKKYYDINLLIEILYINVLILKSSMLVRFKNIDNNKSRFFYHIKLGDTKLIKILIL